MPFLAATMSATMQQLFLASGLVGTSSLSFCSAVSTGSQLAVVGKPFSTTDIGMAPGAGPAVGKGVGLIVDSNLIKAAILSKGISSGLLGTDFSKVATAAAKAFAATLALADLSSTHAPVYSDTGQVVLGSIPVTANAISNNIIKAGKLSGLLGQDFSKVAKAIGFGFSEGLKLATGSVMIKGAPGSSPAPGSGKSISGIIS